LTRRTVNTQGKETLHVCSGLCSGAKNTLQFLQQGGEVDENAVTCDGLMMVGLDRAGTCGKTISRAYFHPIFHFLFFKKRK
jgi:hypothetical protein